MKSKEKWAVLTGVELFVTQPSVVVNTFAVHFDTDNGPRRLFIQASDELGAIMEVRQRLLELGYDV